MINAYASYFVSYLLNNLKEISSINKIILFGSVARREAEKNSDVDIFIDMKKINKKLEGKIRKLLLEFYNSREALIFKVKNIDNKINLIIGKLDEWKELKKSIESTGIILYGKYSAGGKGEKKYVIIFWDKIGKNRGSFLNKLYGVKINEKRYIGLIERFGGRKVGKSSIILPIEYRDDILEIIRFYNVNAKIIEVYM